MLHHGPPEKKAKNTSNVVDGALPSFEYILHHNTADSTDFKELKLAMKNSNYSNFAVRQLITGSLEIFESLALGLDF